MTAKHKLNVAFLNGALLIASCVGVATGSATAFAVALVALIVLFIWDGDIR